MRSDFRTWIDAASRLTESAQPLLEVELADSVFDQAAREMLHNIDWSSDGEMVLDAIDIDADDLEPGEKIDINTPEIQAKLFSWAKDRVDDAYNDIDYCFGGKNTIRIYREITAPPNWKPDPTEHPGIYWSWDKGAAQAHWGSFRNGEVKWLLTADVTASQINWVQTLAANASLSLGDEREITLIEGTPVKLLSYERRPR